MAKVTPQVLDNIKAEAEKLALPHGLSVEKVQYLREGGLWYLRVILNAPGGVSLSDCELVHRPLSKRLDVIDPIPGSYYLEVTSPGNADESIGSTDSELTPREKEEQNGPR